MSKIYDGGPVFPAGVAIGDRVKIDGGMTLRDYFAVDAPPQRTDLTNEAAAELVGRPMPEWKPFMDSDKQAEINHQIELAKWRIELDVALRMIWADAMLAAREKGGAA